MQLEAQGQAKAANVGGLAAVRCRHSRMVEIGALRPNPRNPNKHSQEQLKLLAACISKQGWRAPIVVSRQSGFVVVGHGRLEAARLLGLAEVPVDEQDFESQELEMAHMIADNRLAELAEISLPDLKDLLQELDTGVMPMEQTGFDHASLGLLMSQFHQDGEEECDPEKEWEGMPEFKNEAKGVKTIFVHFETAADVAAFAELLGQEIGENTKYLWFPKKERRDMRGIAYKAQS